MACEAVAVAGVPGWRAAARTVASVGSCCACCSRRPHCGTAAQLQSQKQPRRLAGWTPTAASGAIKLRSCGSSCCSTGLGSLGLVVVGGHEGHLGHGRVVLLAAHLHLERSAGLGVRLVHVPASNGKARKEAAQNHRPSTSYKWGYETPCAKPASEQPAVNHICRLVP